MNNGSLSDRRYGLPLTKRLETHGCDPRTINTCEVEQTLILLRPETERKWFKDKKGSSLNERFPHKRWTACAFSFKSITIKLVK